LEEERKAAPVSLEASAVLVQALASRTPAWHEVDPRIGTLLLRLALLREQLPEAGIPEIANDALALALIRASEGRTRLRELRDIDWVEELLSAVSPAVRALLERETPERIVLPGGRALPVHYEAGKPPWVESRLQDFFGMIRTPTLCKG